jgi:hypothetical protein
MTNQEIVERALKFIHNPNWEYEEALILHIATQLAKPLKEASDASL